MILDHVMDLADEWLDYGERLVLPHIYEAYPWLYPVVNGYIYLVSYECDGNEYLDFVPVKKLDSDVTIIARFLWVEVREKTNSLQGRFIQDIEYKRDPESYSVLGVYVEVADKMEPWEVRTISQEEFHEQYDSVDYLGSIYLVSDIVEI